MPQFLHSTRRGVAEGLGAGLAPPPRFPPPQQGGDANQRCSEEGLSAQAPRSGRVDSNPSPALTTVTLDSSFPLGPSSLSLSFPIFPEGPTESWAHRAVDQRQRGGSPEGAP